MARPAPEQKGDHMRKTAKKLTLSSETLRNLDGSQMQQVAGALATFVGSACTATNVCSACKPCF